jgi:Zn-dependent protease
MAYKLNARKIRFREFRNEASWPVAALGWFITRLVNIPAACDIPAIEKLDTFRLRKHEVSAEALSIIEPAARELTQFGFGPALFHRINDINNQTTYHFVTMVHSSGKVVARVRHRVFRGTMPHKTYLSTEFLTVVGGAKYCTTVDAKADVDLPATIDAEFLPNICLDKLWERHQERIAGHLERGEVMTIRAGGVLVRVLETQHRMLRDEMVARGVFDDSCPALAPQTPTASANGEDFNADDGTLAAVRKIEKGKSTTWLSTVILLAVSIGLFMAAGGYVWSWRFTALLIPILFFHEAGHYAAMKLFDYKNLRMFFIPFFGAAVTGRSYNVPGWKRAIVSLMGPVPGIMLGIVIGVFGVVSRIPLANEFAIVMLLLNGFNLLPALPLDGGWIVHALLFCRHPFLDLAFRIVAILVLFGLATLAGDRIFLFLAIATAISLPTTYRVVMISKKLRNQPELAVEENTDVIPASTVSTISRELDGAYPKGIPVKTKAQLVLQIFENINAKPPGWIATLALGTVYLGSIVAVVGGGVILLAGQQPGLARHFFDAMLGPRQTLVVEEIESTDDSTLSSTATSTIVANYDSASTAVQRFHELSNAPDDCEASVIGQTLCLSFASDVEAVRNEWFDILEVDSTGIAVDGEEYRAAAILRCSASDAASAEAIETQLMNYFQASATLVPPWSPDFAVTQQHNLARTTLRKFSNLPPFDESEHNLLTEHYELLEQARKRGNSKEIERLEEEQSRRYWERENQYYDSLKAEPEHETDQTVLKALWDNREATQAHQTIIDEAIKKEQESETLTKLYENAPPDYRWDSESWPDELAARLRVMPSEDGTVSPGANRYSCDGSVRRKEEELHLEWLTFDDIEDGLPMLLRWLAEQGCQSFKYSIHTD